MFQRGRRSFAAASTLALLLTLAGPPASRAADTVVWRYATGVPEKSLWGRQTRRWADTVAEETGGGVKLQIFFGSQLGGERDVVPQIARGRIDAGVANIAIAALLAPELQLVMLPMFFRSPDELDCVLDNGLADDVAARLAAKGVHVIGLADGGTLELIGHKPFTGPAELAGLRIATYASRLGPLTWQALGAHPTPLSGPETTSALQTGLIDATTAPIVYYLATGQHKVAPVMTQLDLFFIPVVTMVNKAAWDRLTPAQREGFERARARIPIAMLRRETRAEQERLVDEHLRAGGRIVRPTTEQREAFRQRLAAAWPKIVQEVGPEGPRLFARMEALRKSCEARR